MYKEIHKNKTLYMVMTLEKIVMELMTIEVL